MGLIQLEESRGAPGWMPSGGYSNTTGSPSAKSRGAAMIRETEAQRTYHAIATRALWIGWQRSHVRAPVCELSYLGSILPTQARQSTGEANSDTSLMDGARGTPRAAE